jgi:ElaB/YqjD/DUF883 family membrane-anchored ribosome-binding protein
LSKEEKRGLESVLPEETIKEIRARVDEVAGELKKKVEEFREKRRELIEDKTLMAMGVAFAIGLALGVALARSKE